MIVVLVVVVGVVVIVVGVVVGVVVVTSDGENESRLGSNMPKKKTDSLKIAKSSICMESTKLNPWGAASRGSIRE